MSEEKTAAGSKIAWPERAEPTEVIAQQLMSINGHLASIAGNLRYLTEAFKKDQE
jgi:hypothetical protein